MSTPAPSDYEIIDVICYLIKQLLDLDDDHVWIYNQKKKIPPTPGLFVEVSMVGSKPYGVNSECRDDDDGNFTEFQSVNIQEIYTVTLYSRDESAKSRAWEVHAALSSVLSEQMQELYNFKLGQLPTGFVDTSALEASARLFRQDLTFNALRVRLKTRVIQYFDKFNIPPNIHVNQ